MANLPTCVVTIAAVAVGVSPGLTIRSAGSIARLLYRVLGPRPEVAHKPGREPERGELADVWQLRKGDKGWHTSRAEPLSDRGRQPITCVGFLKKKTSGSARSVKIVSSLKSSI
jgi:hypothetical protein